MILAIFAMFFRENGTFAIEIAITILYYDVIEMAIRRHFDRRTGKETVP